MSYYIIALYFQVGHIVLVYILGYEFVIYLSIEIQYKEQYIPGTTVS